MATGMPEHLGMRLEQQLGHPQTCAGSSIAIAAWHPQRGGYQK
jgi:hypothetical protein